MKLLATTDDHEIFYHARQIVVFPVGAQVSCYICFEGLEDALDAIENKECECYKTQVRVL